MRRKLMIKTVSMAAAFLVVNVFFAGCSERTVDYSMEDVTENTERGNGKRGLEQFADASAWEDEWTAVNTKGNTVTLQVKADVILPEVKQMSVVEAKAAEFDAAFKQRVVKGVFGSEGSIYYYDLEHLPKEDLTKLREESQSIYDEYARDKTIEDPQILESMKWTEENIKYYDKLLETAGETYIPAENFDGDAYLGMREGEAYELSFVKFENDTGIDEERMFFLERKNLSQYISKDMNETGIVGVKSIPCSPYTGYDMVKNQCELSEEEARERADRFVKEMGMEYSVYAYSVPLVWGTTWDIAQTGENCDGYVFYYDAGIDGVSFVKPGTEDQYQNYFKKKESEPKRYRMNARMEIYVNGEGILYMKAYNPIEFTGVSEGVTLLALEDIRGIIKEAVTDHFGDFRFNYTSEDWLVTFNEMELIYFRVRDKENEGHYSYVPAWRLGDVSSFGGEAGNSIDNAVLINAIDGSVIDFYDEV